MNKFSEVREPSGFSKPAAHGSLSSLAEFFRSVDLSIDLDRVSLRKEE